MGYGVAKPFGLRHERVIDYASRCRDDFMDVYLMGHCRFVLGTTSGICDIAMLFDVPRIGTNWVPLGSAPWGKHCLFIPKPLRDRATGRLLPFGWFLDNSRDFESDLLRSPKNRLRFVCEDNTPEDNLAVTEEMMARIDGSFTESDANRALQDRYLARFPADHWSAEVRTPMGRDFLAKHRDYFLES
jgi:putative glycosyltransferase (TIGR04372 family)